MSSRLTTIYIRIFTDFCKGTNSHLLPLNLNTVKFGNIKFSNLYVSLENIKSFRMKLTRVGVYFLFMGHTLEIKTKIQTKIIYLPFSSNG